MSEHSGSTHVFPRTQFRTCTLELQVRVQAKLRFGQSGSRWVRCQGLASTCRTSGSGSATGHA
eukprot:5176893-Lingulodinium_polyedra.AAC.1